jgi:iron complex outermembrane receptor protein
MKIFGKKLETAGLVFIILASFYLYTETVVTAQERSEKTFAASSSKEKRSRSTYELETMTVTAQKREENVQDVPASISVFSDIQVEDAGIENTFDLIQFSPNVHMQNNYSEHVIVIRGISSFNTSIYSPAGYYVDDVSYPLHYMHNAELFDVERAEILRGPQGTLYGRNSESGVINIITKQPDNEFRGKVFGEYGNYNTFRSGANISGPIISDKLYMGVAFQYKTSDGYVKNEFNDDDEAGDVEHRNGRATLRWTPTNRWDISLIADVMDTDDHAAGYRWINGPQKTDPFKVRHDSDEYSKQDGNGQTLRVKYTGDSFNVLSVSSLLYYKHDYLNEADLWDDPMNKNESILSYKDRQYSQELRVSSPQNSGPFEWLAGVYGFKEETDTDYNYYIVNKPAWGMSNMSFMNPVTDIDISGYAAFGQGTYTLFERLHLTAGLRYDHQSLEGDMSGKYFDFATFSYKDYDCDKDLDYDEWLPKFSIAYDVANDVMTYVSASKGYIVGGYNYCMFPAQETFSFDPEYTWNYEAGIKTSWLDNKLMVNLAIFYIDIDDKQVSEVDLNTVTVAITNAAKAHSQGVELELQAKPVRGLDLFASFGYTEAKFDDFTALEWNDTYTALVQNDYKDNYLPYAPKYTYNLGVQYRHESGFFSRADLFGTDKFYGNYASTVEQKAYQTVNLRLGYEGEHFDFIFWGKNVFDEEYLTYIAPVYGYDVGVDGPPQTFGATLTYWF